MFYLFFVFLILFMIFFCYMNFILMDYFIWWSIFVISTFLFVIYFKAFISIFPIISYYLIQELCGYFFLILSNFNIQFFLLLMKAGVAPFHFWIFSVTSRLVSWLLMWFFWFTKNTYFPVIFNFWWFSIFLMIILGLGIWYLNNLINRDFNNMMIIFSTESFNWLLLFSMFSFGSVYLFFIFYYFFMFFLIPFFSYFYKCMSWELILLFFNIPVGLTFFLKIMVLFFIFNFSGSKYLLIYFLSYYLLLVLVNDLFLGVLIFFINLSIMIFFFFFSLLYFCYFF
uniref:NADH dehydrogenase subunit 2 n=1 Tax=Heliconema longissimum TaxID=657295 RepID=G4V237_9BILA|nr:NADH dehydrogenase subunit 2 [Heliconema longissimum]ACV96724.1 NADH dehydrogenase subunit 2 [Heliconema longissimum]